MSSLLLARSMVPFDVSLNFILSVYIIPSDEELIYGEIAFFTDNAPDETVRIQLQCSKPLNNAYMSITFAVINGDRARYVCTVGKKFGADSGEFTVHTEGDNYFFATSVVQLVLGHVVDHFRVCAENLDIYKARNMSAVSTAWQIITKCINATDLAVYAAIMNPYFAES